MGCYTFRVAIALALVSAAVYGVSDYLGGRTSRRFQPVAVALCAELTLLVTLALLVPIVESDGPTSAAVLWGAAGGLSGTVGVLGLYHALSKGNMTVVAPVTGLVAAAVPVVVGVALGERPTPVAVVGIVAALLAVALIGGMVGVQLHHVAASTLALAGAVGVAFGLLFVAFSRAGDDTGLWPLLAARLGATPLIVSVFVWRRRTEPMRLAVPALIMPGVAIGLLVGVANGTYLSATRRDFLSIVAVLASMYPASTVALASLLDGERPTRAQLAGMGVAAAAVTCITLGS